VTTRSAPEPTVTDAVTDVEDGALAALTGRVFDAVLFDMDGTLIDSTPSVDRSWAHWATGRGLDRSSFEVAHGVPARQILATFLPDHEVDAALAQIEALEVADADGIVVLPGALDALAALPLGRAAIVTSCTLPLARARIAATALPAPAVVVTADAVAVGKPDPAPYLLAAHRLGADPARCLVVEDAPAGLAAGRAAGCATLALTTTHAPGELVADALVATLAQVSFRADADGVRVVAAPTVRRDRRDRRGAPVRSAP
jgi:sugar-phosphatase